MAYEVILPRVDMSMTHGRISRWHVAAGATVAKGQPLFEIETDKAAMEIEAPAAGTVQLLEDVTDRDLEVGTVVAWILDANEAAPTTAPVAEPVRAELAAAGEVPLAAAVEASAPPTPMEPATASAPRTVRATPVARRLASANGLDLAAVPGSGPRGRVQGQDVASVLAWLPRASPPTPAMAEAPVVRSEATSPPVRQPQDGTRAIAWRQLRDGVGDTVLFLHGYGADATAWRPLLAHLAIANPLEALDLPGHGDSAAPVAQGFDGLVDAVALALRERGVGRLHLVGHSLGGAVAAALAAGGSLDVRSLCLLAPAGLGPAIDARFVAGFAEARSEAALAVWMARLVADPAALPAAMVRATRRAREEKPDLAAALRTLAAGLFPDGTQLFSIRAHLARLATPCRVVVGLEDRIIPPADALGLPAGVALHRLPGVGHLPQLEAPALVGRLVGEVVRSAG